MFNIFKFHYYLQLLFLSNFDAIMGGGGSDAPNYTPVTASANEAAALGQTLGDQQKALAQKEYDKETAVTDPVVAAQLGIAKQQAQQGTDAYNYVTAGQRPVIDAAAAQALKDGTEQNQQEMADKAIADSRAGYTNAANIAARTGIRYGFSPDRIAANADTNAAAQATSQAAAATTARQTAIDKGMAEKATVAQLYNPLLTAAQNSQNSAVATGTTAAAVNSAPGQAQITNNQNANATTLAGKQIQVGGLSNVAGNQTSNANANAGSEASTWSSLGQIAGTAAMFFSDEDVKKDIKPMSATAALDGITKLPIKKWKYDDSKIDGQDDEEHIGAMAGDIKKNLGNSVSNGKTVDIISAIGVNMAAIKALSKKVDKMGARA